MWLTAKKFFRILCFGLVCIICIGYFFGIRKPGFNFFKQKEEVLINPSNVSEVPIDFNLTIDRQANPILISKERNSKILDLTRTCEIPSIDTSSEYFNSIIKNDGKGADPYCINNIVHFKIDYTTYSIVKTKPQDNFWKQVKCCFRSYWTHGGALVYGKHCLEIANVSTTIPLNMQALDILCTKKSTQKVVYRDQFPVFRINPELEAQLDKMNHPYSEYTNKRPSILVIELDSVSHPNFNRYMRKSYNFLKHNLSALEFHAVNKVGRGSPTNLIGITSGCRIIPPIQKPYPVGGHCKLIWELFAKIGYRTLHFEDSQYNVIDLFPGIRHGKSGSGAHYDLYSFMEGLRYIDSREMKNTWRDGYGCYDNQFVMDVMVDPILQVSKLFQETQKPYIQFVFFQKTGHGVMSNTFYMDDPVYRILEGITKTGANNNTIIFILSDHGPWMGSYVNTEKGKLERLLPTLFIALPDWFKNLYPMAAANAEENTMRLVTHYDIHQTFMSLLNLSSISKEALSQEIPKNIDVLGITLFRSISINRTCPDANIPDEFCICHKRTEIPNPKNISEVSSAVKFALKQMNAELIKFPMCAILQQDAIMKANTLKSHDSSGVFLEVDYSVSPSNGTFQATLSLYPETKLVGRVLRTNVYKGQSDCIEQWSNATYAKTMCYCI